MIRRIPVALLAVLTATVSFARAEDVPPRPMPSAAPSATPTPAPARSGISPGLAAAAAAAVAGVNGGQAQPYAQWVKNAEVQRGVIDLVRKEDDVFLDLRPENFDRTYIILPSIERGVGGGAFAGKVYEPLPVTFKRVGKRVLWITPNTRYVAQKGSAAAASLAISVADSVILSTPIVAEDSEKQHIVVAPSIFQQDFLGIGADLGRGAAPPSLPGLLLLSARPSFAVDPSKSYYGRTKAFPRNDEISVNLAFNGPPNALPTVPDGRGIPIVVHYSVVAPPERDPKFVPRYADDRVGYFITARKRYGNDTTATPIERFIERWNIESGPITFYLTDEIPAQYRDTVRRGILAWNSAFARVGRPNAIVVKDPPAEAGWDPDDARYTTVRWITSDRPDFSAYSPHVSDPDTGQIIRAEVVIDGESLRDVKRGYVDRVMPSRRAARNAFAAPAAFLENALTRTEPDADAEARLCELQEEGIANAALGAAVVAGGARGNAADRERYAQQWLYSTVMHEVGHTLGLRHNFRGSTAFTYARLHDPAFTRVHGTTGSVMDYTPANLAAPGERQADVFPAQLGPYDLWAIEYGYRTFANVRSSADEAVALSRIAARSTEPGLAYGTDEDATASGIDPRIERFDLSRDALAYIDEQFRVDDAVTAGLMRRYPGDHRSFEDIRGSLITVLQDQLNGALTASRYLGGIYTSRAHRDEPGAPLPFTPVPRAQSRRAFDLVAREVFSSRAFALSPELLNAAAPSRYGLHWGSTTPRRADFPIREVIGEIQDDAISEMFSPANMGRIADQELKVRRPGDTMSLADLFAWTNGAIYDDVGRSRIAPTHRELQRRFADLQMQIFMLPSVFADQLLLPRETQALARRSLTVLAARLDPAIRSAGDPGTRAHLEDLRARVRGVLEAHNVRSI